MILLISTSPERNFKHVANTQKDAISAEKYKLIATILPVNTHIVGPLEVAVITARPFGQIIVATSNSLTTNVDPEIVHHRRWFGSIMNTEPNIPVC